MSNKNFFITGVSEMLFLSILAQSDSYVYEITKLIAELTDGVLVISPNTIYTVAYKLEQDGYISEYSKQVGRKRTRIYYHLEPKGREYLNRVTEQYEQVNRGITQFYSSLNTERREDHHE